MRSSAAPSLVPFVFACVFAGARAAYLSRSRSTLEVGSRARWNPFKAVADAVRSRWSPTDKMRHDLCWDRDDLLHHEDCMEWMVAKCNKKNNEDSKKCAKLEKYVVKHCEQGSKTACKYAEQLGISMATTTLAPAPLPAPAPAPASSPGASPGPAPAAKAPAPAPAEEEESPPPAPAPAAEEAEAPAAPESEGGTTGRPPRIPSQGFEGKKVRHTDGKTYSGDWGDEYEHPTTTTAPPPPRKSGERPGGRMAASVALVAALASGAGILQC